MELKTEIFLTDSQNERLQGIVAALNKTNDVIFGTVEPWTVRDVLENIVVNGIENFKI